MGIIRGGMGKQISDKKRTIRSASAQKAMGSFSLLSASPAPVLESRGAFGFPPPGKN